VGCSDAVIEMRWVGKRLAAFPDLTDATLNVFANGFRISPRAPHNRRSQIPGGEPKIIMSSPSWITAASI
jgi:hypothetical protein